MRKLKRTIVFFSGMYSSLVYHLTPRHLHAHSHRHPSQKSCVINALFHWVISLSQPDYLQAKLNHVQNSLVNNCYRKELIHYPKYDKASSVSHPGKQSTKNENH